MTPTRRRILQSLTIGAGASTFAPALQSWRVRDVQAAPSVPRRLLVFFHQNGFRNRAVNEVSGGALDFKLGDMSAPLAKHRSDLVVLSGLSQGGSGHNKGYNGMLTGKPAGNTARRGAGISIDRHLARLVGARATPGLPNLHLGMHPISEGASFDEAGTLVRPNPDPYAVYDRVFKELQVSATLDPAAGKAAENRARLRKGVLDGVAADVKAFKARLAPEDRLRMDAQLDALESLEARLTAPAIDRSNSACAKPGLGMGIPLALDPAGKSIPAKAQAQLDLIVAAFACDLTRIATFYLEWQNSDGTMTGFAPVDMPEMGWHAMSHQKSGPGYQAFVRAQAWAYGLVSQTADRLKATPEGPGTMLDNTVILVVSEISLAHSLTEYVWYSVGGKNLGVKGGRMLDLAGTSSWKLHTSIMNMMGVPGNFGDATGALPGYPA